MRNITAFAVLVIILHSIPVMTGIPGLSLLHSEEAEKYSFHAAPLFGIIQGRAEEIVYPGNNYRNDLLSELLWNIEAILYYGMNLEFTPAEPLHTGGVFAELSVKYGIPAESGIMENRDWQSYENKALTDYSRHDNYVDEIYFIDFRAGYSFPVKHIITIKPHIAFSYAHLGFSGRDGYGKYARPKEPYAPGLFYDIDDSPRREEFSGKVISYSQDWMILATGFSMGINFLEYFFFEAAFDISPLIMCLALDKHIGKNKLFKDLSIGGLYLEPRIALTFTATRHMSVTLDALYRNISGSRGYAYDRTLDTALFFQNGESGAALTLFDISLLVKVRL